MTDRTPSRPLRTLLLALAAVLVAALLWAPPAGAADGWRWPVEGSVLTTYRNGDDPYAGGQHRGIDIGAPAGARVVAASDGTVTFAGVAGDAGLTVAVRTADGALDTSYLHLGSLAVRRGERVAAGDPLGTVGTSGRRSIAEPHLHLGVREAGTRFAYRDPLAFLPPPAAPPPPSPRAVPVAVPEPPAVVPRLIPVAAAASPVPLAAPAPLREPPALAPIGAPAGAASPAPLRAPAPAAAPRPSPAGPHARRPAEPTPRHGDRSRARDARPASHGRRAGTPLAHVPALGPAGQRDARDPHRAAPPRSLAIRPATPARRRGGLDLGWLAACLGLVAVATLLGRPRGPSAGFRRASSIAAWATTSPRRSTTSTRSPI